MGNYPPAAATALDHSGRSFINHRDRAVVLLDMGESVGALVSDRMAINLTKIYMYFWTFWFASFDPKQRPDGQMN